MVNYKIVLDEVEVDFQVFGIVKEEINFLSKVHIGNFPGVKVLFENVKELKEEIDPV